MVRPSMNPPPPTPFIKSSLTIVLDFMIYRIRKTAPSQQTPASCSAQHPFNLLLPLTAVSLLPQGKMLPGPGVTMEVATTSLLLRAREASS